MSPSFAPAVPRRPRLRLRTLGAAALLAALPLLASPAGAQQQESPDAALARARRAVDAGNTGAGRTVLDSLVGATSPGAPHYPELLFWRATYAATAAEAERDYRRLAIEYPLSARAEDALLRLAQLELARGDQALALKHLERLILEHPESVNRARARYWMGRAWLEQGNLTQGCDALRGAIAATRDEEVELRTQVTYAGQRCPRGWADGARTPAVAVASVPRADTAARPATPAVTSTATPAITPATPPIGEIFAPDTSRAPAPAPATPPATAMPPAMPAKQVPAQPIGAMPVLTPSGASAPATTSATTATTTPPAAPKPAAPAPRTAAPAARWAVQVAAYDAPGAAEALVRKLRARGIDARVDGTVAPYRVRVGRWTRAEAVREAQALKARGIAGFVVEAVP